MHFGVKPKRISIQTKDVFLFSFLFQTSKAPLSSIFASVLSMVDAFASLHLENPIFRVLSTIIHKLFHVLIYLVFSFITPNLSLIMKLYPSLWYYLSFNHMIKSLLSVTKRLLILASDHYGVTRMSSSYLLYALVSQHHPQK